MTGNDDSRALQAQVEFAYHHDQTVRIVGGGSKAHLCEPRRADLELHTGKHYGVVDYQPSELFITARTGSRLADIQGLLAREGQMFGFEPPALGQFATLGGSVACGLSGPRRPFSGSLRDALLGCTLLTGRGEILRFGGQVIKNVAGFDVSRLMAGAFGSLGLLLEVTLRVSPVPEAECHLRQSVAPDIVIHRMAQLSGQAWPLSGLAYDGETLHLRLSGAEAAIRRSAVALGGEADPQSSAFWENLREQRLDFFNPPGRYWRLSVPSATPALPLPGAWLLDWGGAQRWLHSEASPTHIHEVAGSVGGHAFGLRGMTTAERVLLSPALLALHHRVRDAFDPKRIFNPGQWPI